MAKKTIRNIIKIAKKEVGYLEKKSNKHLNSKKKNAGYNNFTKYNVVFDVNGCYWCCYFICWLFYILCDEDKEDAKEMLCGVLSGSCDELLKSFKKSNRYDSIPQKGDLVFFSGRRHMGATHIALIYKIKNNKIYTIEGNTSVDNEIVDNGGCVAKKCYSIDNPKIIGYGHPKY